MMKDDDFKLLRGFDNGRTDGRTNEQTFVIVESLLRLKIIISFVSVSIIMFRHKGTLKIYLVLPLP